MAQAALQVRGLGVSLPRQGRSVAILTDLDLAIPAGEMLALVGESGSGKTVAALAVMRLLPSGAITTGSVALAGRDLTLLPEAAMRGVRGRDIGMVFQDPLAALNPSHSVGRQIAEAYRIHAKASAAAGRARALDLLGEVGIANPAARIDDYPHQFSGGMRQRVMIAAALAGSPRLLIADEPCTGLDPVTARQIMALIARLQRERGMAVLFVTHDLSAITGEADRVQVLYAGRTVEHGAADALFAAPRHPYSRALLGAVPRAGHDRLVSIPGTLPEPEQRPVGCTFAPRCANRQDDCAIAYPAERLGATAVACLHPNEGPGIALPVSPGPASPGPAHRGARLAPLLTVAGLSVKYNGRRVALADVSFDLARGECLGVVGQSGSGKTTLGRAVLQMAAHAGSVVLDGIDLAKLAGGARRRQLRRIQVVFQDPRESLNPRLTIAQSVAEPLRLAGLTDPAELRRRVDALLERVGLGSRTGALPPHAVSGGQAQRVAIARALAAEPDVIVFDEPTSALDVSTQATLLNLLRDLLDERQLGYIFITHDVAIAGFMADRILVLREGRMVELGEAARVLASAFSGRTPPGA